MIQKPDAHNGAVFSDDRRHRYALWRYVGDPLQTCLGNYCMFIGLNPSTADETKNDPTIRRCMAFAKAWGHTQLVMCNMFAFRSTDPDQLLLLPANDAIGPDNDVYLETLAKGASVIVAAWGANARHYPMRTRTLRAMFPQRLHYLRLTAEGHPSHPLYLPKDLQPQPWLV